MRAFILGNGHMALAAMLLALSLRLVLPAGVMPEFGAGHVEVAICTGMASAQAPSHDGKHAAHDTPCAFSGLAFAALAGGALAVVPRLPHMAQAVEPLMPLALRLQPHAHTLPPAQGPPQARSA